MVFSGRNLVFVLYQVLRKLLISEAVFLIGRPRRTQSGLRLAGSLAVYLIAAFFWNQFINAFMEQYILGRMLLWTGLFVLTMGVICFCFDMVPVEVLFAGTGGYVTEHISFALGKIIQYGTGWNEAKLGITLHTFLFRFFIYIVVAIFIYFFVVRRNRNKGDFKPNDTRIALLTLVILMAAIVLSVVYFYPGFMEQGTVASKVICPLYAMLCCILVLFLEFYVLRENRMEREREVMEQMLHMANAQRKTSQETIDIINMKCHDLKHQIQALAAMRDENARSEYVAEVERAVSILCVQRISMR